MRVCAAKVLQILEEMNISASDDDDNGKKIILMLLETFIDSLVNKT